MLVAALVIVTPGQDTALTIRNTLAGGRAAGWRTAAGVVAGQAIWALAAAAGLAALAALGLVFCTLTLAWLSLYGLVVARAGDVLRIRLAGSERVA